MQWLRRQRDLISQRHALDRIDHATEVVGMQFRVLDALLRPVLIESRDSGLRRIEGLDLVTHALFDEDTARVLLDDVLFVLPATSVDQQVFEGFHRERMGVR